MPYSIVIPTTKRYWQTPPCLRFGHNLQSQRIAEKVVFPINACISKAVEIGTIEE